MAADLIQDGVNGFLCEIEDVETLTARALQVIGSEQVRERFRSNGYRSVENCDFRIVARRHYEEVYRPLLQMLL
jgi:glycosyltransferase involved in cell wall biosynthesis